MPDRRDFAGTKNGLEWIYISPKDAKTIVPMLIAPLPYHSVMGRKLDKSQRIVVDSAGMSESIDEEEAAELFRTMASGRPFHSMFQDDRIDAPGPAYREMKGRR